MARKKQEKHQRKHSAMQKTTPAWLKNGAIVGLVVIVLAGGLFLMRSNDDSFGNAAASAAIDENEPALGPITAPVTIVEYGDFGCPACRSWHQAGIKEQVLAQYGDQVRFVWRDFPVITPMSPKPPRPPNVPTIKVVSGSITIYC